MPFDRVDLVSASYREVPTYISKSDFGIFFIKPVRSKKASCPTRMGEFLACGKPCLANSGVGDVEQILSNSAVGVSVTEFDDETLLGALKESIKLATSPEISKKCVTTAEYIFSLRQGVESYQRIYDSFRHVPS